MAVVELERDVTQYRPRALHVQPEWIAGYPGPVQKLARAAIDALDQIAASATKEALVVALRRLEFPTPGQHGEDALRRGRAGETLTAGDWDALAECVQTRMECEAREAREREAGRPS